HDGVELLRAGRLADGVLEAVTGGRMAHAGAGIDVVRAERGANELLHEVRLFVRAAGGRDAADRELAVLRLDTLELARGVVDRLVPARLTPGIVNRLADERGGDAILVCGVAV